MLLCVWHQENQPDACPDACMDAVLPLAACPA